MELKNRLGNISKIAVMLFTIFVFSIGFAKTREESPKISLRTVTIKNLAYSSNGKFFAVPNFISAGSVGVFKVSQSGKIPSIPDRLSERNFYRVAGVFYFQAKDTTSDLIFIPQPELLSGWSVTFMNKGDTMAVAGSDKVFIYSTYKWKLEKTITVTQNTTRAIFSPDNSKLGVIADGKIYVLSTKDCSVIYTIEPETGSKFADIAFSESGEFLAAFEYRNVVLEHSSRIRIFQSVNGDIDRNLPYFDEAPGEVPGSHFPLVSFSSSDTALAVTLEKGIFGKTLLIKENDGMVIRNFKGLCHAFSPDGSLFATGGKIYSTRDWKEIGKYSSSATSIVFSPTERVLVVAAPDFLTRYRIIEE